MSIVTLVAGLMLGGVSAPALAQPCNPDTGCPGPGNDDGDSGIWRTGWILVLDEASGIWSWGWGRWREVMPEVCRNDRNQPVVCPIP